MSAPRHAFRDGAAGQFVPVGIPLGDKGVDLRGNPRFRTSDALSELVNARFTDEGLIERRLPSFGTRLKDQSLGSSTTGATATEGNSWAYGAGSTFTEFFDPGGGGGLALPSIAATSAHHRKGSGVLDNEGVISAWTGDRFLQYDGRGRRMLGTNEPADLLGAGIRAWLPSTFVREFCHGPDEGTEVGNWEAVLGLTTYMTLHVLEDLLVARVYSRETNTLISQSPRASTDTGAPSNFKGVFSDGRYVIYWIDDAGGAGESLFTTSTPEAAPLNWDAATNLGEIDDYDVVYVNDRYHLLVVKDDTAAPREIRGIYYQGKEERDLPFPPNTVFATVEEPQANTLGLCATVAPNGDIALGWRASTNDFRGRVYSAAGTALAASVQLANVSVANASLSAGWLPTASGNQEFLAWLTTSAGVLVKKWELATAPSLLYTFNTSFVASRAFRVGDAHFCWIHAQPEGSGLQNAYYLIGYRDFDLRPHAVAYRGDTFTAPDRLTSVLPDPAEGTYGTVESATTRRWMCALGPEPAGTWDDQSLRYSALEMDFLPPLRWTKYGRAVYTAGSMVNTYDNQRVVEAGWHQHPEVVAATPQNNTGGAIGPGGDVRYRVYACWPNSKGELFRSQSLTSDAVTLAATDDEVDLEFTNIITTAKPQNEIFFEIYRTETNGTTFYLVGTLLGNHNQSASTETFTDTVTDAVIVNRPIDPHNPLPNQPNELEEAGALPCEWIHAHGDRVWGGGGFIPPGMVQHSKLKEEGEGAGWNPLVGLITIDGDGGRLTSASSMSTALLLFERDAVHDLRGGGPDNLGLGAFPNSNRLPTTDGAVTHEGTAECDLGVVYWSETGPRLMSTGYQPMEIGMPVEPLAKTVIPTGVVVIPGRREARWYCSDNRGFLLDYSGSAPRWGTIWGPQIAGATTRVTDGRVFTVSADGWLYEEDEEGQGDGGLPFEFSFATAELRPSELAAGNNSVIRTGFLGERRGPCVLRSRLYYNGAANWEEEWAWTPEDDLGEMPVSDFDELVQDILLGDPVPAEDDVLKFVRRPRRHHCSSFRVRMSDGGSLGDTMAPHEILLELGQLPGLTQGEQRTFSDEHFTGG